MEGSGYLPSRKSEDLRSDGWRGGHIFIIWTLYVFDTCPVLVLRGFWRVYLVRKDVVVVWGMIEDSQLFSLEIPAPVVDGRLSVEDRVKAPRKYCTQGLNVPLGNWI